MTSLGHQSDGAATPAERAGCCLAPCKEDCSRPPCPCNHDAWRPEELHVLAAQKRMEAS